MCARVCAKGRKRERERARARWGVHLDDFIVVSKLVGATLHVLEGAEVLDQELSTFCTFLLNGCGCNTEMSVLDYNCRPPFSVPQKSGQTRKKLVD